MSRRPRPEEVWAVIVEFPSYAVSNYGRVLHIRLDRLLQQHTDSYGFMYANLWRNGENHRRTIHHLVAEQFLSFYTPGCQLYHFDDDKQNNFVENMRFSRTHHSTTLRRDIVRPIVLPTIEVVETGQQFKSVFECARAMGLDFSTVYKVLNGEREHHKGYTFRRLDT